MRMTSRLPLGVHEFTGHHSSLLVLLVTYMTLKGCGCQNVSIDLESDREHWSKESFMPSNPLRATDYGGL